ncbi:cytosine deaminase [Metabacillus litoralis]|jgi:cytosine/creatinine deaminase|uniref:cytosine deaminase n=1 Tax=Metabacillus litoralis TaxID=152268 RepID=UPI00203AF7F5|nr:cytosine deaminase [Metabacillus litoralis]MCM3653820.1 cytosine deaminase [Metabacillus litoralis]
MILKSAKLYGQEGLWNIEIKGEQIVNLLPADDFIDSSHEKVIDLAGKLVLPPFVEPHIHLDYVLTAGTPRWNQSGTLFEGIQCWSERKLVVKETKEDIKRRALKAIEMQMKHGIQHVRTHVDITDPSLIGLEALLEIREEIKPWMDIQIVAFPQEGIYAYPKGDELLEEALKMGADVVGGIPHYEFTREDGVQSVKKSLELAYKYGKMVDIHCDEIDDEQSRFVEVVAAEAYKLGMGELVTASHTTAMGSYNDAYTYKLFKLLKQSKINFVALPKANLHLQGRFDSYPKRRGLTRVKELLESDINVCFGLDSIMDPWYPLGDGNLIRVVEMGLHACHMTGYNDIVTALNLITSNGAKTLNIEENYGIKKGNKANLVVINTESEYEAVRCQSPVLYSIRNGEVIVETKPAETKMNIPEFSKQFSE